MQSFSCLSDSYGRNDVLVEKIHAYQAFIAMFKPQILCIKFFWVGHLLIKLLSVLGVQYDRIDELHHGSISGPQRGEVLELVV